VCLGIQRLNMAVERILSVSVCTYNMHGYRSGSSFLKHLCLDNDKIFVQEHWLFKSQLHLFNDLAGSDFCFYGDSAMNKAQECRILRGRSFGGVGSIVAF